MKRWTPAALFVLISLLSAPAAAAVWGSFDATRLNYEEGTLAGPAHATLRGAILKRGDVLELPTAVLDDAYLSSVDVFYTGLLDSLSGAPSGLSADERTALSKWLSDGGTLIVTADYDAVTEYSTFTTSFGVGSFSQIDAQAAVAVASSHPLIQGVGQFRIAAPVTFDYGSNWQLLASVEGQPVMAVLEDMSEDADFTGRILVVGDSNCFTEAYIAEDDTTTLATNMVAWAAERPDVVNMLVVDSCGCSTPGGSYPSASLLLLAIVAAAAAARRRK